MLLLCWVRGLNNVPASTYLSDLKHLKMISSQFNSNSKLNSVQTVSHRVQNAYKISFYGVCNLCKIRPSHKTSKDNRTILQWKVIKTPVNVPYDIITVSKIYYPSLLISSFRSVGSHTVISSYWKLFSMNSKSYPRFLSVVQKEKRQDIGTLVFILKDSRKLIELDLLVQLMACSKTVIQRNLRIALSLA